MTRNISTSAINQRGVPLEARFSRGHGWGATACVAIVLLGALACLTVGSTHPSSRQTNHLSHQQHFTAAIPVKERYQIRLAVFRYLIAGHCSSGDLAFVSIDDSEGFRDPPPAMIGALNSSGIVVEPGSREIMRDGAIRDRRTWARGLLFSVSGIHFVSQTSVDVKGGGLAGPGSGSFGTFRVVRRNGQWRVLKFTVEGQL